MNRRIFDIIDELTKREHHWTWYQLNGKSPYEKTKKKYPLLLEKLNYKYINPDDVALTKESILGDE